MEQIIYGDILFIINFSMDFLALYASARILSRRIHILSAVLAASLGALYAIVSLFTPGNAFITLLLNAAIALLMCYIVFGGGFSLLLRSALLFCIINLLIGGGMTALMNLINALRGSQKVFMEGHVVSLGGDLPPIWILLAGGIGALVAVFTGRAAKKRAVAGYSQATITFRGRSVTLSCLRDSGNLLSEPVSGRPVIVTTFHAIRPLLSSPLDRIFRRGSTDALDHLDITDIRKIRLIPSTGAGYAGLLIGLIPDTAVIDGIEKDICLAALPENADGFRKDADFDAIIPMSLAI